MAEIRDYNQLARMSADPRDFASAIAAAVPQGGPQLMPPIDRNNRDQVLMRQIHLQQLGAPVKVDGVYGPETEWWEGVANAGQLKPVAPAAPAPAPAAAPRPAPRAAAPAASGGGGSAGGASGVRTSPKPLPADWMNQAREQFPALAGILEIPEIALVAMEALQWEWPPDKLVARLANTQWYKETPQATRQWIGLKGSDPATAQRMVADSVGAFRKMAGAYLIDMGDEALAQWSEDVLSGKIGADGFQKELVNLAKGRFPSLASQLDQGLTVRQVADPYVKLAARELEIPEGQIDLMEPKWSRALDARDEKGAPVSMTLYDWQATIRQDVSYGWDRTSGARSQAADFVKQLGQTFGRTG